MRKIVYIGIILICIAAGVFAYLRISQKPQGTTPTTQKSDLTQATIQTSFKNTGEPPTSTPNVFRQDGSPDAPQSVITDSVTNSTTATLVENETYSLYAFSGTDGNSFMISLHSQNLRQARIDAEKELLRRLNVTQEQACKMYISVTVMTPYNDTLERNEVGLSFCPDRLDLPVELPVSDEKEREVNTAL